MQPYNGLQSTFKAIGLIATLLAAFAVGYRGVVSALDWRLSAKERWSWAIGMGALAVVLAAIATLVF